MEASVLRDLLAPFFPVAELDDTLLAFVGVHLELLTRWNQRMNLTALRTAEEMVVRHFGESLFAARHLFPRDAHQDLFDLGSGAGFPGLPIKYWAPALQLTLIEGHGKRPHFSAKSDGPSTSPAHSVLNVRAESISQRAALVTMRAVEKFDQCPRRRRQLSRPPAAASRSSSVKPSASAPYRSCPPASPPFAPPILPSAHPPHLEPPRLTLG